jgi:spore coat polysaccharide biosynthesis protein SpsF (cytidylyltransferase family)
MAKLLNGALMLKGSESDVHRSFYQAVKDKIQNGSLESPDCPLIDPELVDKVNCSLYSGK